jgi:hypothetical protein
VSDKINTTGGVFNRVGNFLKKEINGEPKEEEKEGTWSNSTMDYVTKGAVTGGLTGAGMGAIAHYAGKEHADLTYKYEVPKYENKVIGQIPSDHVAANPDTGDPAFITANGKPVAGKGVNVFGNVPEKGILGGFKMDEKTAEAHWKGNSLMANVLGGALIGTVAGAIAGLCLKVLNGIIHPKHSEKPWERSAPPAWDNAAPPAWKNSGTSEPWSRSAPAWSNAHNKAPWSNEHSRSHSNYSDTHNRSHSNYSDTHYRSHDNYGNSHSNYSNSHSNSWDRHVSY